MISKARSVYSYIQFRVKHRKALIKQAVHYSGINTCRDHYCVLDGQEKETFALKEDCNLYHLPITADLQQHVSMQY